MRLNYAIVFVSSMKESVAFYRDVIGLPVRFETSHWSELEAGAATLALHLGEKALATEDPIAVRAARCRPGLSVPDLDAFHQRMVDRGVPCLQEPKEVFGSRVAQYQDPDGLPISVGEERPAG